MLSFYTVHSQHELFVASVSVLKHRPHEQNLPHLTLKRGQNKQNKETSDLTSTLLFIPLRLFVFCLSSGVWSWRCRDSLPRVDGELSPATADPGVGSAGSLSRWWDHTALANHSCDLMKKQISHPEEFNNHRVSWFLICQSWPKSQLALLFKGRPDL